MWFVFKRQYVSYQHTIAFRHIPYYVSTQTSLCYGTSNRMHIQKQIHNYTQIGTQYEQIEIQYEQRTILNEDSVLLLHENKK